MGLKRLAQFRHYFRGLFLTLYLAWRRGFSPLEMLSVKIDAYLVEALRKRFGPPGPS